MSKTRSKIELAPIVDAISFGGLLIIVAVTWMYHTWLPSEILAYFRSFETFGRPVAPPPVLFEPAIFFAYVLGTWQLVLAAGRALARIRGVSGNAASGIFFIFCGYLFEVYIQGGISAGMLMPVLVILIGTLVTIVSLVKVIWQRQKI